MLSRARISCIFPIILLAGCCALLCAQHPANANATYQKLRGLLPGDDVIAVNNLELRRNAGVFTFSHGNFAFYGEVNGKVTGAVFKGEGHFHLTPPTAQERHNLAILNKSEEFDEDFNLAVLRFTDATADKLRKAAAGKSGPDAAYGKAAEELQSFLHHNSAASHMNPWGIFYYRKIEGNLDLRLLEDVLSPAPGGFFYASMHGNKSPHFIFQLDPLGVAGLAPEEVSLQIWDRSNESMTYPLAFHSTAEYANGNKHNAAYTIASENLDVTIEGSGFLSCVATVEVRAEQDSVAVIPLDLYPTLRVSNVETDKGAALDYVQEKKDEDADFGVVLAQPLKKGESTAIRIAYSGKDVVMNEGNDNYYPLARQSWYPNGSSGFGNFANYHMFFHVPKGLQLIATGTKVSENTDGKITTTEWKTEVPLPVVGFNLGKFAMKEAKVENKLGDNLIIDAYANTNPPDMFSQMNASSKLPRQDGNRSMDVSFSDNINTISMLSIQLSQGEVAAKLYTDYFGVLPFNHIALTQQFACNYGQSWPMLVYLPICGFFDDTQRHFLLGSSWYDTYWKVVTPHEVAHQWWGQTVGFRGYRDQWMSEGFANTSATIFLQATNQMDVFFEFWKQQRKLLTEKNQFGFRPIDVGPVTMGSRLNSPKAGWNIYQNLVYPKGAYILHMIQMMMWTPRDGDVRFKDTMHDLVESYRLQAATTEDFKAVVEKHMSPGMDLDGNHRMDWFFNQYVYGTDLPAYHFDGQVTQNGDATSLHFKLTQSGVSPNFRMLVPVYLELADGKFTRLGMIPMIGSTTFERTLSLPKYPSPVKRALVNYYYDVLAIEN